eukprot:4590896-Pyramimonas_sp.AAC.1
MTHQSDTGNPTAGLDTDTVELTAKTLLSHLVTLERIRFSRRFFTDAVLSSVEPCHSLGLDMDTAELTIKTL